MNVLVLAQNDSNNIQISNILVELLKRGHALRIFARCMDEKSTWMFRGLHVTIRQTQDLRDGDIAWADCIWSCLRAHMDIGLLGEKVLTKKYIFMYDNYLDDTWHTGGADFMFSTGYTRHPRHEEDCARMSIGCPKNDYMAVGRSAADEKMILFIDSGHYPFSHTGKAQIAELLLQICHAYADYSVVVKPRFLPGDRNMLHSNDDHLYQVIEDRAQGEMPENLTLLREHIEMQELIDRCSCAIMLCTSAYLDVALRGKRMLILEGIDNEDKYELRNEIEYRNIYRLRRESGCVVRYEDAMCYLPEGLRCDERHLDKLVAYRTDASVRIVDVMEHVVSHYLKKGQIPGIRRYDYETYQEEMAQTEGISWESLLRKRIKNHGNDTLNLFNRIVTPIDVSAYISMLDEEYVNYPTTEDGLRQFLRDLDQLHNRILINNRERLMKDPLDQAELFRALYRFGRFADLLAMREEEVLCKGAWNYYVGMIRYRSEDPGSCQRHFAIFLEEAGARAFAKYECENPYGIKDAYAAIANAYDDRIDVETSARLLIQLYERRTDLPIGDQEKKRLFALVPDIFHRLLDKGNSRLADRLFSCYQKQYEAFCDARVEEADGERRHIQNSVSYQIGRGITLMPRRFRQAWRSWKHSHNTGKENPLRKLLLYRATAEFRDGILDGWREYQRIVHQYGEDAYLCLSAGGTGDAYISNQYYNRHVASIKEERAVYVLPGASCYNTTKLFSIPRDRTIMLERENWLALLRLLRFMGGKAMRMDLLYYHIFTIHQGYLTWLEGFHDWNLYALMKNVHFSQLTENDRERPRFVSREAAARLMEKYGLERGKTVILAPYAKWPPAIKGGFWEYLANRLLAEGYQVCTNSVGESEPPIEGTVPIKFSYEESVPLIEECGYLVGLRSGFLDIVESADAKKVALYPYNCAKRGIADGSAMKSFSLNAMFGGSDWLELEVGPSTLIDTAERIVSSFGKTWGKNNDNHDIHAHQA